MKQINIRYISLLYSGHQNGYGMGWQGRITGTLDREYINGEQEEPAERGGEEELKGP